jgi:cell division protein FtsB
MGTEITDSNLLKVTFEKINKRNRLFFLITIAMYALLILVFGILIYQSYKHFNNQLSSLQANYDSLSKENMSLAAGIKNSKTDLEALIKVFSDSNVKDISDNKQRIEKINTKINELFSFKNSNFFNNPNSPWKITEGKVNGLNSRLDNISQEITEFENFKNDDKSPWKITEGKVNELNSRLDNISQKITEFENFKNDDKSPWKITEGKVNDQLENLKKNLDASWKKNEERINEISQKLSELGDRITALEPKK